MGIVGLVGFVLLAAPALAQETDESDETDEAAREAELFGEGPAAPEPEPAAPAPAPAAPATRDDALLGSPFEGSEGELARRLTALDDRLTLGGRIWLQTVASAPDGADGLDDVALSAPNRLDLFVDARPNDRVRAYASGRLQHDWTVREGETDLSGAPAAPDAVLLDQLWTKFDIGHRLFVTAGRQRIRWGAGRFWNPSDFLNQQRLDPLAILDLRTGVDLLKLHLPIEPAGMNVYAVANLADSRALDEIGGALRAELAFDQTEITASAAARKDQPERVGADLSSGVGPFDVRLEASLQHGAPPVEPVDLGTVGGADLGALVDLLPAPPAVDGWQLQLVAGLDLTLKYSAEDSLVLGVEGFYNPFGTDRVRTYPRLLIEGRYVPLYVGRAYGAAYVLLAGPGRWDDQTFLASVIANLSDDSAIVRTEWRGTALTWLQPNAYIALHAGEKGEFRYGVDIPPIPGLLPDGLSVPPPLVDVGVGAIVRF